MKSVGDCPSDEFDALSTLRGFFVVEPTASFSQWGSSWIFKEFKIDR